MLDLAPMRERLTGPERKHRSRVLGAREGTPGWEAGAEATMESGPRAGTRWGERAHRVVPGSAPLAVAAEDDLGSVQRGCMEQGPAPVGGTLKGGTLLDKCSQVVLTAQGPRLLKSEWTVGTRSEKTLGARARRVGSVWGRTQAESGRGLGAGSGGGLPSLTAAHSGAGVRTLCVPWGS